MTFKAIETSKVPAFDKICARVGALYPGVSVLETGRDFDSHSFCFRLGGKSDRTADLIIPGEQLDDLRDNPDGPDSQYTKEIIGTLDRQIREAVGSGGLASFSEETLQFLLLKFVVAATKGGASVHKYNAIGRGIQGDFERWLRAELSPQEKESLIWEWGELLRLRMIAPTGTDLVQPDDWVKATDKGREIAEHANLIEFLDSASDRRSVGSVASARASIGHKGIDMAVGRDRSIPTAFMSYSWDSLEHKQWVFHLAERLRTEGGVDVILDRWHLPVGGDRTHFMETSIQKSDFVLLVCTPTYAQKSNARSGGVGYEATILTGRLAQDITQNKFIPVLRVGEWDDSAIPIWLQTKIGVDFRSDPYSEEQYQLLLRTLHQAQEQAPLIGPKPNFQAPVRIQAGGLLGNAVSAVLESASTGPEPTQAYIDAESTNRPKESPAAYAFYEIKGTDAKVQVFVRPIDLSADLYSFETSTGEYKEGLRKEINLRYLSCDLDLRESGYTRMQSFNGTGGQGFNLPS